MTYMWNFEEALQLSSGDLPGISGVNKFGANQTVTKETTEDIWDGGGTYSFPTTADITHISQAVADIPMQAATIQIQGLDANWVLTTQTVALSTPTTTAVALTTPLIRVFRMKVLANVVAAQAINLKNVGGATTYATIQAGNNQTLMAIYTVPAGKTARINKYFASVVEATGKEPKSTNIRLWTADRLNGYEFQLKHAVGVPKAGNMVEYCFTPLMYVSEKTDIKMTASPSAEDAHVNAGFDLTLVNSGRYE